MFSLACVTIVVLGAAAAAGWLRAVPSVGLRPALALVAARACASAAIIAIVWTVFRGGRTVSLNAPSEDELPVIVLEDASASMTMAGSPGRAREDLADSVWDDAAARARRSGRRIPLRRLFFGENLVEASGREPVLRDGSRLASAFTDVITRRNAAAVLIVSDGATTDGLPSPYLVDWARNRGIRIGAVCAAFQDQDPSDRSVEKVDAKPENPPVITATIRATGKDRNPIAAALSIDGRRAVTAQRPCEDVQDVSFRVPPLSKGWHEYAVEVEPTATEATDRNNVVHGVFRATSRGVLLVRDRPRAEDLHLARFLAGQLGGAFRSVAAAASVASDQESAALVVIADVPPEKIPEAARSAWLGARTPLLLLGGDSLKEWADLDLPGFPLASVEDFRFLGGADRSGGEVTVDPAAAGKDAFRSPPAGLRLDLIEAAEAQANAAAVYGVRTRDGVLPLLAADSLDSPRLAVLLTDTTWKWAQDPDGTTRKAYQRFWSSSIEWLLGGDRDDSPLALEVETPKDAGGEIHGWVAPAARGRAGELRNCRVAVNGDALVVEAGAPGEGAAPGAGPEEQARVRFHFRAEDVKGSPAVLWLQASADLDGKAAASSRTPVVLLDRELKEFRDVHPAASVLKRLTTGEEGSFSWYPERTAVIDWLFRSPPVPARSGQVRRRDALLEAILAAAALLCLAAEWWLERKARAGGRA